MHVQPAHKDQVNLFFQAKQRLYLFLDRTAFASITKPLLSTWVEVMFE